MLELILLSLLFILVVWMYSSGKKCHHYSNENFGGHGGGRHGGGGRGHWGRHGGWWGRRWGGYPYWGSYYPQYVVVDNPDDWNVAGVLIPKSKDEESLALYTNGASFAVKIANTTYPLPSTLRDGQVITVPTRTGEYVVEIPI